MDSTEENSSSADTNGGEFRATFVSVNCCNLDLFGATFV